MALQRGSVIMTIGICSTKKGRASPKHVFLCLSSCSGKQKRRSNGAGEGPKETALTVASREQRGLERASPRFLKRKRKGWKCREGKLLRGRERGLASPYVFFGEPGKQKGKKKKIQGSNPPGKNLSILPSVRGGGSGKGGGCGVPGLVILRRGTVEKGKKEL